LNTNYYEEYLLGGFSNPIYGLVGLLGLIDD